MIDFNTLLNAAFDSQIKPLTDKIEALEKRVLEMEEFFNKWNFGNDEKFGDAVVEVLKRDCGDWVEQIARDEIETKVEQVVNDMDFTQDIEKALDNIDLDDRIKTFIKDNVTISAEIDV